MKVSKTSPSLLCNHLHAGGHIFFIPEKYHCVGAPRRLSCSRRVIRSSAVLYLSFFFTGLGSVSTQPSRWITAELQLKVCPGFSVIKHIYISLKTGIQMHVSAAIVKCVLSGHERLRWEAPTWLRLILQLSGGLVQTRSRG